MIERTRTELIKLEHIIKYAVTYIPYYKGKDLNKIEDFPIIEKNFIKKNYGSFLSDQIVDKDKLVRELEADFSINDYVIEKEFSDKLILEWTTGTSGVPFKCVKSVSERKEISLAMWKKRMKVDRGILPKTFLPMIHTGSAPFKYDIRDYSYDNLQAIYKYIGDMKVCCVHTSPTILQRHLTQPHSDKIVFPPSIKYIESTGRYLEEDIKKMAEEKLNAKIINMYGTIETWGIASTCQHDNMHINTDNIYIELIDESGRIINEADKKGMVVVTSLNQYLMPFIRYKLNDYAMYIDVECQCGERSRIIQLCKCRENQYIYINGKKISGDDFVKKILRKVEYNRVFQDMLFFLLIERDNNKYEVIMSHIKDEKGFENLFTQCLSDELRKFVNISFLYMTQEEYEKINPKSYLYVRKQ